MKLKSNSNQSTIYFSLFLAVAAVICEIGFCGELPEQVMTMNCGGISDTDHNSVEIESLGRFAVQQHNQNQNTLLHFARIVKAKDQVVAGMMYHLTLEVVDGGKTKIYEAKVWVKPWMNFKQLQEFKEVHDNPITSSYLGIQHGN